MTAAALGALIATATADAPAWDHMAERQRSAMRRQPSAALRAWLAEWAAWRGRERALAADLRLLAAAPGNRRAREELRRLEAGIDFVHASMTRDAAEELARRAAPPPAPTAVVSLEALVARHAGRLKRGSNAWLANCPFHAGDRGRHLYLYESGYGHCFSCGAHKPLAEVLAAWA